MQKPNSPLKKHMHENKPGMLTNDSWLKGCSPIQRLNVQTNMRMQPGQTCGKYMKIPAKHLQKQHLNQTLGLGSRRGGNWGRGSPIVVAAEGFFHHC